MTHGVEDQSTNKKATIDDLAYVSNRFFFYDENMQKGWLLPPACRADNAWVWDQAIKKESNDDLAYDSYRFFFYDANIEESCHLPPAGRADDAWGRGSVYK
jgi:hypothetical protein